MWGLRAALGMRIAEQTALQATPRHGTVQSFNPNTYQARVLVQPEGTLTGWLPIHAVMIGNGWGIVCAPSIGDQVKIEPVDGDPDNWEITGRIFSTDVKPPVAQSGDIMLISPSGAFIKLLAAGGIQSAGTWMHTGTIAATGDITAGAGTGDQVDLLMHTHTSETVGTPTSAPIAGT